MALSRIELMRKTHSLHQLTSSRMGQELRIEELLEDIERIKASIKASDEAIKKIQEEIGSSS